MSDVRFPQAGLAGALALAAGSTAYGAIIVVSPPADVPNAASPASNPAAGFINWDVDGDAVSDFRLQFRNPQSTGTFGVVWQANFSPFTAGGTNAVVGYMGPFVNYGAKLNAGDLIGPTAPGAGNSWRNPAQVVLGSFYRSGGVPSPYGGFSTGTVPSASIVRGFVGFRFTIGGNTRYGWLDVEVRGADTTAGSGGMYFFGAAYEDTGDPIPAGAVPAPGSLAALALGAAACARRSRRSA
ncbi:MAG: hypothetical protein WD749_09045 [Phycisphaerales bacterium]